MRKFLVWFILVLVLFGGLFIYWKYFFTYSEGYRAGLLQKFSLRGNIFKTYEGEIILSSVQSNKDVAIASEKFFFSVEIDSVAEKLTHLEGYMVVVHYRQRHGALPWRGETPYFVDSVRIADDQAP